MKLTGVIFAATVSAAPSKFESENFITSEEVTWRTANDNVMGGSSLGTIEHFGEYIHFTGQLDLIDGGFAGFNGQIGSKLTGYDGKTKFLKKRKITGNLVLRVSARTPTPERTFKVGILRDTGGTWYHKLSLEQEFKSFEIDFDDFYFSYHGIPGDLPPPLGSQVRQVRINISDEKPEPFEADINIIQGV